MKGVMGIKETKKVICPYCGTEKGYRYHLQKTNFCSNCGKQFHAFNGVR